MLLLVAGCESSGAPPPREAAPVKASVPVAPPAPVADATTNIHPADYIGPDKCGTCHADEHARWRTSLHRRMNQRVSDAAVIGDFNDARVPYAGGELHLTHDAAGYAMTTAKAARTTHYRITRTIGVRGLQEYVGIEDGQTEEVRLPFAWWPRLGRWVPQPYFDTWLGDEAKFDAYAPVREPWAERCPWCHSTYPFEQRIARSSGRKKLGHGLEQFFTSAPQGERLGVEQQVTTGISCESCHLGGKSHAAGGPIDFVPRGAAPVAGAPVRRPFAEEKHDARIINTICSSCHSGPSPKLADGTSLRNSREGPDLAASSCTGLACTDCHDPHKGGSDEARSIAACASCHAGIASDPKHAHHKAVNCLDCHMPKVVMGLDHFVRTHRISSPVHVTASEPNACNLCHLDRSLSWAAEALADYGAKIPRDAAWPELEAGTVWLTGKRPHLRVIAAFAYARSPLGTRAKLEPGLTDPLAYVRAWTKFAIEDIVKAKIDVPKLVH